MHFFCAYHFLLYYKYIEFVSRVDYLCCIGAHSCRVLTGAYQLKNIKHLQSTLPEIKAWLMIML